jgi:hypothetical protein
MVDAGSGTEPGVRLRRAQDEQDEMVKRSGAPLQVGTGFASQREIPANRAVCQDFAL